VIKFLAQLFRGLHYIIGISVPPPGTSDHTFVFTRGIDVRVAAATNRFGCGGLILPARVVQMRLSPDELQVAIKIGNGKSASRQEIKH
jgi:hypothetical protein